MITAHPETNAPSPLEDDIKTEIVTDTSILSSTVSSSTKASSGENWQGMIFKPTLKNNKRKPFILIGIHCEKPCCLVPNDVRSI